MVAVTTVIARLGRIVSLLALVVARYSGRTIYFGLMTFLGCGVLVVVVVCTHASTVYPPRVYSYPAGSVKGDRSKVKHVNLKLDLVRQNLRGWPARRWLTATGVAVATYVVIAIPTVLLPNPWFTRMTPPTAWAQPVLIATAIMTGLLVATYVAHPAVQGATKAARLGGAGAIISFFAVGCPVCNKLVLIALGTTGAMQYFEPIQPYLAAASIGLLLWALYKRVTSEDACPVPLNTATEPVSETISS